MRAKPENEGKCLRVYGKQGGGPGLPYRMTFEGPRDGDNVTATPGVSALVDQFSANHLRGALLFRSIADLMLPFILRWLGFGPAAASTPVRCHAR